MPVMKNETQTPTGEFSLGNLWKNIKDGMSGCSQPPLAVKPLCFPLALPSVPFLSPNPFQLVVLSNFTQSSRSLSRKKRNLALKSCSLFPFPVSLLLQRPQIDSSLASASPKL